MKFKAIVSISALPAAIVVLSVLVLPNINLYSKCGPYTSRDFRPDKIVKQLSFLRTSLDNGGAGRMQAIYPEGYFFLHVLYGVTWSELALMDTNPVLKRRAAAEAVWALGKLESPQGYEQFDPAIEPRYGIFYTGWLNYLRARIIELRGIPDADSEIIANFTHDCTLMGDLYDKNDYPYLPSLDGMAWPGDNSIAVFSLYLHDRLFERRYDGTIRNWIAKVKKNLDPTSGMPPFEVTSYSHEIERNTRGSAQALLVKNVAYLDSNFAKEQYDLFRKAFFTTKLGIPLIREYPNGKTGAGDYDSGPIIWDVGASATIVALGTLRRYNDTTIADALEQSIEMLGFPIETPKSKKYALGLMPMGDAFLAWSKIALPAIASINKTEIGNYWRIRIQAITVICCLIVGGVMMWLIKKIMR